MRFLKCACFEMRLQKSWVARPSMSTRDKYGEVSKLTIQTVHSILAGQVKVVPGLTSLQEKLVEITGGEANPRD